VLPARLATYSTAWLDSLMQTSGLSWFGCGEQRLSFAFPEELGLFREQEGDTQVPAAAWGKLVPDPEGRYGFPTIRSLSGKPADSLSRELWMLAWQGAVSNDAFVAVRKGILNRFRPPAEEPGRMRRSLASRWQAGVRSAGNWYGLPVEVPPPDPLEREETNKERVRVLLERYGIIFRELLLRELPPLQWQRLFRTLRIMELSGELLSGSFFHGIPGLQFISHEAFRMLTQGLSTDAIYWLNAADPVSLAGLGLEGLKDGLPPRIPGTHLVYHGTRLVVVSRRFGRELRIDVEPDDPHLPDYLAFFRILLSREFNPRKIISVERINGITAAESAYRQTLVAFGFQESYKGLELWRKY
jgi:ATP-dependent Lhr-like helicase